MALEVIANAMRLIGLLVTIAGLWFSAGGMRVVVSGRIDERRRSAKSLKLGLPLLVLGIALLVGGIWLANWVQAS
jgi:O-antigen/teichoic acid export membrane protein